MVVYFGEIVKFEEAFMLCVKTLKSLVEVVYYTVILEARTLCTEVVNT